MHADGHHAAEPDDGQERRRHRRGALPARDRPCVPPEQRHARRRVLHVPRGEGDLGAQGLHAQLRRAGAAADRLPALPRHPQGDPRHPPGEDEEPARGGQGARGGGAEGAEVLPARAHGRGDPVRAERGPRLPGLLPLHRALGQGEGVHPPRLRRRPRRLLQPRPAADERRALRDGGVPRHRALRVGRGPAGRPRRAGREDLRAHRGRVPAVPEDVLLPLRRPPEEVRPPPVPRRRRAHAGARRGGARRRHAGAAGRVRRRGSARRPPHGGRAGRAGRGERARRAAQGAPRRAPVCRRGGRRRAHGGQRRGAAEEAAAPRDDQRRASRRGAPLRLRRGAVPRGAARDDRRAGRALPRARRPRGRRVVHAAHPRGVRAALQARVRRGAGVCGAARRGGGGGGVPNPHVRARRGVPRLHACGARRDARGRRTGRAGDRGVRHRLLQRLRRGDEDVVCAAVRVHQTARARAPVPRVRGKGARVLLPERRCH